MSYIVGGGDTGGGDGGDGDVIKLIGVAVMIWLVVGFNMSDVGVVNDGSEL